MRAFSSFPSRLACLLLLGLSTASLGADLEEADKLIRAGKYDECIAYTTEEIRNGGWNERWYLLKIEAELARGKYADALATYEAGLRRFPSSVNIRWRGVDVARYNGKDDDIEGELETIERLILNAPQRFSSPQGRVTIGRFFLDRGADARKVLDQFYDVATKQDPKFVDGFLATAELALAKQDAALAAQTLAKAPKTAAEDPRYHYLLALAFADDDRVKSAQSLAAALKINPRHIDSLLLQADQLIDAERYTDATETLKHILEINPSEPRAWAYKAVLAHLKNDLEGEESSRKSALEHWEKNPEVDHIRGKKLSQKYRFVEGSAAQKQAFEIDPEYLPAKIQLCQDLLRLGKESEGWTLAAEIFAKDGYNVVAFNLIALRDRLKGFRTLETDGFIVRMDPLEADLYGERVLSLLSQARKTLCEKYEVNVEGPVTVEIFPQKKEFAVRTFGLPGADGLLGVCFGKVITANSPASQGETPSNWEAVLWHEYCHVVTLIKTRNKMPRWLSEGISVYEEGLKDPAWATPTNPKFRAMLLGNDFTPLSKLSSAFLAPKSALHVQFAYHESALAVEFLVGKVGMSALKGLLDDIGKGISLNEALPARSKMTLEELDTQFSTFAKARANHLGTDLTWEDLDDLTPDADSKAILAWLETHPKSFQGRRLLGSKLVSEGKLDDAKPVLEALKRQYPEYLGPENPYVLLAAIYRKKGDAKAEHAVLDELTARTGDSVFAFFRLMELDAQAKDDKSLAKNARRLLAVNPLLSSPHRQLALAAERLGQTDEAIAEFRALALLDETDPAGLHYHLAKLLQQSGKPADARLEVLKSLEDAPRFLEAHTLLLELTEPGRPK